MKSGLDGVVASALQELQAWLEGEAYRGWDPHDGLNSALLAAATFKNRYLGMAALQLLRRLPINVRPMLGVEKGFNPKGVGLFLSAYLKRYAYWRNEEDIEKAETFARWLEENRSEDYDEYCWGYNFAWPNRTFYISRGVPTIVNTSFIAHAFLDAYEVLGEERYLKIARSSCTFITNRLNRSVEGNSFCFSYTPVDDSRIHNANMLGAALLARVYSMTREEALWRCAESAVRFTMKHQNGDGSWYYGQAANQRWIDLFHTGYVLERLEDYMRFTGDGDYEKELRSGAEFFRDYFFLEDGVPKYYHDRVYPIDTHCSAQAIVTLLKLKRLGSEHVPLARKVAVWTIHNMQDANGYFYYQKHRLYTNRIPYMRWCQAWMFYSLTSLLLDGNESQN